MNAGAHSGEGDLRPTPARGGASRWVRAATDRVPTKWFAGLATALFLAGTAAFGGLSTVAAEPVRELSAGQEHINAQLALSIQRAVLVDELPEVGVEAGAGERVLALIATVENRWTQPLPTVGDTSVTQAVRVPDLGDTPPAAVARYDDATRSPWLQPRVPAEVVLAWTVDAGAFEAGDILSVELRDAQLAQGRLVTAGEAWVDPVVAARVSVSITDVGAGASTEEPR
ncbi:hypothetical protein F6B41_14010 [Microbacterium lushaniae]|nr:hypothetical protein F6B41_29220 [Microbacterium lushaniae]KAA9154004.1 hypothetical protein F6B41_14010 [Microbacterium lushaniae]